MTNIEFEQSSSACHGSESVILGVLQNKGSWEPVKSRFRDAISMVLSNAPNFQEDSLLGAGGFLLTGGDSRRHPRPQSLKGCRA